MLNHSEPFLVNLFIFVLFLLSPAKTPADELSVEISQLQNKILETNEKIASLESNQQKIDTSINTLRSHLNSSQQKFDGLNTTPNQLTVSRTWTPRTANGHGR